MTTSISEKIDSIVYFQGCHSQFLVSVKQPGLDIWKKSQLNNQYYLFSNSRSLEQQGLIIETLEYIPKRYSGHTYPQMQLVIMKFLQLILSQTLIHSDIKRFSCHICGKQLKNDSCYRRHMVCVHGQKFTCELCNKDFSALNGINLHKREVHGIMY